MKQAVRLGCSSYNNRYWKGIFYPEDWPVSKWFAYYCQHFNTYEMNGTFYRFPTLPALQNWYDKSPEGFVFSVKVPKEITHLRQLADCQERLSEFYTVCRDGLREKLGPVLFQFPSSFSFSELRLERVLSLLDTHFVNVVEFRHASWWTEKVWEALPQNHISCCSVSYPNLPQTIITGQPITYLRLHGIPELFYAPYSKSKLLELREQLLKTGRDVFIYFNNTAGTAGIENALTMKALLG